MDADRFKGAARELGGKIQSAAGKLTDDDGMQAEGATREAAGKVQGVYGEVKDKARHAVDEVSDFAQDAVHHGSEYARQGAQAIETTMTTYPVVYLALAAAFGFLAALLLNERRR